MKDTIIAGTGNSRMLKSAISADITFTELVSMLRKGTFPIDISGPNPAGIKQRGTNISAYTLLKLETAQALDLPQEDPTPSDAFEKLSSAAFSGANGVITDAHGNAIMYPAAFGSYIGTGQNGASNPNSLTFDFEPKFLVIFSGGGSVADSGLGSGFSAPAIGCTLPLTTVPTENTLFFVYSSASEDGTISTYYTWAYMSKNRNTVYWYHEASAASQYNILNTKYYYLALGGVT